MPSCREVRQRHLQTTFTHLHWCPACCLDAIIHLLRCDIYSIYLLLQLEDAQQCYGWSESAHHQLLAELPRAPAAAGRRPIAIGSSHHQSKRKTAARYRSTTGHSGAVPGVSTGTASWSPASSTTTPTVTASPADGSKIHIAGVVPAFDLASASGPGYGFVFGAQASTRGAASASRNGYAADLALWEPSLPLNYSPGYMHATASQSPSTSQGAAALAGGRRSQGSDSRYPVSGKVQAPGRDVARVSFTSGCQHVDNDRQGQQMQGRNGALATSTQPPSAMCDLEAVEGIARHPSLTSIQEPPPLMDCALEFPGSKMADQTVTPTHPAPDTQTGEAAGQGSNYNSTLSDVAKHGRKRSMGEFSFPVAHHAASSSEKPRASSSVKRRLSTSVFEEDSATSVKRTIVDASTSGWRPAATAADASPTSAGLQVKSPGPLSPKPFGYCFPAASQSSASRTGSGYGLAPEARSKGSRLDASSASQPREGMGLHILSSSSLTSQPLGSPSTSVQLFTSSTGPGASLHTPTHSDASAQRPSWEAEPSYLGSAAHSASASKRYKAGKFASNGISPRTESIPAAATVVDAEYRFRSIVLHFRNPYLPERLGQCIKVRRVMRYQDSALAVFADSASHNLVLVNIPAYVVACVCTQRCMLAFWYAYVQK